MKKEREEWVDIARGIAILLVILGHMGVARTFIYAFHMPVFFFISGYLYRKRDGRSLIRYEWKKIILPYLIWGFGLSIAMYGITLFGIAKEREEFSNLRKQIINVLNGGDLYHIINAAPALWFLVALAETVWAYWCINCVKNKYIKLLIVCICVVFGGYLHFINFSLRFNWNVVLIVILFYYLGDEFRKYREKIEIPKWIRTVSVIISLIILGVGSKINGDVDVHMSQLGRSVLVYYINAIAGIYIIMQISIWLERYSHCAKNFLQKIGTKTLGIMGIHASIIFVLSMLISLGNLWGNIVIFIITVTISYCTLVNDVTPTFQK